ncbi:hypothetical protein [Clostridium novyi]|uniref:hypothetical protein n=1 Tax=Clostridium novyi TaxID=1542 RepID=UPI0004D40C43|nr:hypothetical protein [Clostridium novyi]KEH84567.1 hypothetical protein Z966_p0022 [Clostridium novyi A str. NCTC 538]KEH84641.1 hypothetical protein Z967_p0022 [Clostridium novyi A str. 4540]KEH84715.1 hypothetical protein Z965_p0018 [Clostridium novyi A str. BKT29909]KEH88860.1 hypothetical protein Z964_p0021 [Clostridium novyi A str. GD211209]
MKLKSEIDEVLKLYREGYAVNFAIALIKERRKENGKKDLDRRRRTISRRAY